MVMAGGEEVEAVAVATATEFGYEWVFESDTTSEHYDAAYWRHIAGKAIDALDRVRSRPPNGTEGEDHEAGIEAGMQRLVEECGGTSPFPLFDFKVAARNVVAAYLSRVPSPVSGTEPECSVCGARMEPRSDVPGRVGGGVFVCWEHGPRGTEPDTAKLRRHVTEALTAAIENASTREHFVRRIEALLDEIGAAGIGERDEAVEYVNRDRQWDG